MAWKRRKKIADAVLSPRAMRQQELELTFSCWSCRRHDGGPLVAATVRRGEALLDVLICPLCLLQGAEKQRERRRR